MKQEKNISKPTTKLLHPEGKPWVIFAFLENQDHVRLLENEIEKITQSYRLEIFQHYDQLSKTEEYKGHLIIADYTLAIQENNLLLRCIMHNDKHMPLIVLSTVPGENHAVEAIKQGANNYFLWDELKALGSAITSCLLPSSITKKPVQTKIDFHDYEKFFSFSLDLFCIAYQGNFLHLNKRWETVLGYTRDELEGQPIFSFIHPDDIVSTRQASAMVQKSGRILDFQNRYRHKDGSYRNFVWSSYLHDGYIYATANDITEFTNTKIELQHREKRYRMLFNGAPDAILIADPDGIILEANQASQKLFNYSESEIETLNIKNLFHE